MTKIMTLLSAIRPECDFAKSQDFVADGMLDSLDVIMLISDLDKSFSISIEGTDIVPENFTNLQSIEKLLRKYGVNP